MKKLKKEIGAILIAVTLVTALAGCGNSGNSSENNTEKQTGGSSEISKGALDTSGKSTDFTYLLSASIVSPWMEDYDDSPTVQYWLANEWDADGDGVGTKLNIDFWSPPAGTEADYVNTQISTGEYADVMSMVFSSESALSLYEEGMALDLTDYVYEYMPNYVAFMKEHPELRLTHDVDGEQRIIQLYSFTDPTDEAWGGLMYRRDWIVKYGANPQTGAAFTGEWADGEWTDDVVFPSGNADPVYISDWEWMFEIFETAMKELGITDGYVVQVPYEGVYTTGDVITGFGGIGTMLYLSSEEKVQLGIQQEGFRAYVECMTNWYSKGWVDPYYAEHSSDMFFMVDMPTIYSGKVGMWYGLVSQLLNGLDPGDGSNPWLDGSVIYAAASPVNDVYGDASVQGIEPSVFYSGGTLSSPYIITDKAADKDLGTLLTAIDYLYSDEGNLLYSFGLTAEQLAENPDASWAATYKEWGLPEGSYSMDADTVVINPTVIADTDDLALYVSMQRIAGINRKYDVDRGYSESRKHMYEIWGVYQNKDMLSDLTSRLSASDLTAYNVLGTNMRTAVAQRLPLFINGTNDVTNDTDWQTFIDEITAYDPDRVINALQSIVDTE